MIIMGRQIYLRTIEETMEGWKIIMNQAISERMMFASFSGGECLTSFYIGLEYPHSLVRNI